jgi:hypothetical protein
MTTYYSPGCTNEKAHICDVCESDDGRKTLYWENKEFDICVDCLSSLYVEYASGIDKSGELIVVKRKTISEQKRNEIFDRDGWKCVICKSGYLLQIDHIFPFSKGGKTENDNLQTLCKDCNSKKRVS